jgi:hypothetical protein
MAQCFPIEQWRMQRLLALLPVKGHIAHVALQQRGDNQTKKPR